MWCCDATNFAAMTKLAVIFAAYEYLRSCFSINSLMDWGWCATGPTDRSIDPGVCERRW